jgi:hypothetical protein
VILGIRPEAFVPGNESATGVVAVPDPMSREVLGGESIVRAAIGSERVLVRLFGSTHDVPAKVGAPLAALHLFTADGGARIGP